MIFWNSEKTENKTAGMIIVPTTLEAIFFIKKIGASRF